MKIIPLSEGSFTIDGSKRFLPFDQATDDLSERKRGSLLVEIQPFVVITSRDIILLDTGLGFVRNGRMQIHENLLRAGIDPTAVTKVLLSHLHKDHAGGIHSAALGSELEPAFPKATYYVQKEELDMAREKGPPSYDLTDFEILSQASQVELLNGSGMIDDYIECKISGAHAPFHQVFWIRENEKTVFFGGDEAPQLLQMKHRFVAKYDHDGKKAMQLRQDWWRQGTEEHWTFLFYHDIKSPVVEL